MPLRLLKFLIVIVVFFSGVSLVQGQSPNCASLYATANMLLSQAKSALESGDLATASALIQSAQTLLSPCLSDGNCPSVAAVVTLLEQAGSSSDASIVNSLLVGAQAAFTSCLAVSEIASTSVPTARPTLRPTSTARPTVRPTATPRTTRPAPTPRTVPAATRTFITTKSQVTFTVRYPTVWFDASELENGTVILGNTVGGWVAAGLGVRPRENTDLGVSIGVLRLDRPPSNLVGLLRGVLSSNENITNFSAPVSTRIGSFEAAYSDIGRVGRRVVLINLGNNYVALANIYAHTERMATLYPQAEIILASLRVQ